MSKTVVVLGAYGLIGAACVRALKAAGFRVVGVGRSRVAALRSDPTIEWLLRDIATTKDWADLAQADVVVNAAGALQDGARDNLVAIHQGAVERVVAALQGRAVRFVQISAAGVAADASTEFMRSKFRGDQAVIGSGLDFVILRPVLVIGRQAYGGTALLRASAAMPLVEVAILPDARVQTVFLDDLAAAVVQAAKGDIAAGVVADLTEAGGQSLGEMTRALRGWLGFSPWRWRMGLPGWMMAGIGRGADALGWLGWRSPLRSSALRALQDGVVGDPRAWAAAGGVPCRGLEQTLAAMPATQQERWFARLYLLMPLGVAVLAVFWVLSGVIGVIGFGAARGVLVERGLPDGWAATAVLGGAVADVALGLAVLVRPWARRACLGMVAVSAAYLLGGTIWAGDLWADPLGPFVKVVPGMALALFVAAVLEDR